MPFHNFTLTVRTLEGFLGSLKFPLLLQSAPLGCPLLVAASLVAGLPWVPSLHIYLFVPTLGDFQMGLASNAVWLNQLIIHISSIYHPYISSCFATPPPCLNTILRDTPLVPNEPSILYMYIYTSNRRRDLNMSISVRDRKMVSYIEKCEVKGKSDGVS